MGYEGRWGASGFSGLGGGGGGGPFNWTTRTVPGTDTVAADDVVIFVTATGTLTLPAAGD